MSSTRAVRGRDVGKLYSLTVPTAGNSARLETLLGSIPHYIGNGSLLPDQKGGLAVVNRLVTEWVKPIAGDQTSPLPPFKDFVYQRILNLCLELPVRQAFDYSDVQAYNVRDRRRTAMIAADEVLTGYWRSRDAVQDTAHPSTTRVHRLSDNNDFSSICHASTNIQRVLTQSHAS